MRFNLIGQLVCPRFSQQGSGARRSSENNIKRGERLQYCACRCNMSQFVLFISSYHFLFIV